MDNVPHERNTKAGIQHVRIKQYVIHGPFGPGILPRQPEERVSSAGGASAWDAADCRFRRRVAPRLNSASPDSWTSSSLASND